MADRRSLLLLPILLACEGRVVQQMDQDHFPLKTGNYWCYEAPGGYITRINVTGQEVMGGRWAWMVEEEYEPSYWINQAGEVRRYTIYEDTLEGEVYQLDEIYRLVYRVPFVEGASWSETHEIDTIIRGDTIRILDEIEGEVIGVEGLSLPAGEFPSTYKVRIVETIRLNGSTTVDTSHRWFAPGVGLVKRDGAVLVEYSIR